MRRQVRDTPTLCFGGNASSRQLFLCLFGHVHFRRADVLDLHGGRAINVHVVAVEVNRALYFEFHGIVAPRDGQKSEAVFLGLAFRWPWAKSSAAAATTRGFDSRSPAIIAFGRE